MDKKKANQESNGKIVKTETVEKANEGAKTDINVKGGKKRGSGRRRGRGRGGFRGGRGGFGRPPHYMAGYGMQYPGYRGRGGRGGWGGWGYEDYWGGYGRRGGYGGDWRGAGRGGWGWGADPGAYGWGDGRYNQYNNWPPPQSYGGGFGWRRPHPNRRAGSQARGVMDQPSNQGASLFVFNLPLNITVEDLRDLIELYGNVVKTVIARDKKGKSKGYGFVHVDQFRDAQMVIQYLDGQMCGDKPLYVRLKRGRPTDYIHADPPEDFVKQHQSDDDDDEPMNGPAGVKKESGTGGDDDVIEQKIKAAKRN